MRELTEIGVWSGGTVLDLAIKDDLVLAATFAGIYRSTDGGQHWDVVAADLPDWFIQSVVWAGQSTALAASHMGWLYRSNDEGQTWQVVQVRQNIGIVNRLAASPNFESDGVIFACTEEDGIFKSTDRGRTWQAANFGLLNLSVQSFAFSPQFAQDEIAFAGTEGGGLFRTRNAGRAWRESGAGLPDSVVQCVVVSAQFDQDGIVFCGTEEAGLYRSTDKGYTWSLVSASLAETCINGLYLPLDWASGGKILAAADEGILASSDAGQTWQLIPGSPEYPYGIVAASDALLSGTYEGGVYCSKSGVSWQSCNEGLAAHLPPLVCFSETFENDRTVWMASLEGVVVCSQDGGQTWSAGPEGLDDESPSILISKGAGAEMTLLTAVQDSLFCCRGGVWQQVANFGGDIITALALSEQLMVGTIGGQVLRSRDDGASWEQYASLGGEMVVALSDGYAVTARQTGETVWQLTVRDGKTGQGILSREGSQPIASLKLGPDGTIFCALEQRVLCLQNGKVVGESVLPGAAPVSCLCVLPGAASVSRLRVLAGAKTGLFVLTDNAQSCELVSDELQVVGLHVASPEVVFAATMGGRLWRVSFV